MKASEVAMFERSISQEVYTASSETAVKYLVENPIIEKKLNPAQLKKAQRLEDETIVELELATVKPGVNGEMCVGKHDYFFIEKKEAKRTKELKKRVATALCHRCPVVSSCFERSIEEAEQFGIWGGVDEYARHRLFRKMAADQNKTSS